MSDADIIQSLEQIMRDADLAYYDVAGGAGVSPSTMRGVAQARRLPERSDARTKIIRFVDCNRGAKRRGDVRFV